MVNLWSLVSPGDTPEPVLTIMVEGEDMEPELVECLVAGWSGRSSLPAQARKCRDADHLTNLICDQATATA